MANCAILGYVDDVCRHVVSKDESFHGKIMVLMGFHPMCPKGSCARVVDACTPFTFAFYFPLPGRGDCHYSAFIQLVNFEMLGSVWRCLRSAWRCPSRDNLLASHHIIH